MTVFSFTGENSFKFSYFDLFYLYIPQGTHPMRVKRLSNRLAWLSFLPKRNKFTLMKSPWQNGVSEKIRISHMKWFIRTTGHKVKYEGISRDSWNSNEQLLIWNTWYLRVLGGRGWKHTLVTVHRCVLYVCVIVDFSKSASRLELRV